MEFFFDACGVIVGFLILAEYGFGVSWYKSDFTNWLHVLLYRVAGL